MSRCYSLIVLFLLISLPVITAQRSSGGSSSSHTTYYHSSSSSSASGGSCSSGCGAALGAVFGVVALVAIVYCCCRMGGCAAQGQQQANVEYLQARPNCAQPVSSIQPYSGVWRGSYRGTSWRNAGSHIMSVELTFQGSHVQGYHGSDEVGSFTMEGDVNHNKIAFIKRYGYERPVRYQGVITSQQQMNGTWHLNNGDHGTWELTCVQPTNVQVIMAQPQPVYQATVAQPAAYVAQPQSHVIEMSHLATPTPTAQPFGYASSTVTATPYSNPSPHLTPRSLTPRLSATPQPGTPHVSAAPLNPQAEGMPPSSDLSMPIPTYALPPAYVPTYGVPQPAI